MRDGLQIFPWVASRVASSSHVREKPGRGGRRRASMAQIRHSGPYSGVGCQVNGDKTIQGVPFLLGIGITPELLAIEVEDLSLALFIALSPPLSLSFSLSLPPSRPLTLTGAHDPSLSLSLSIPL